MELRGLEPLTPTLPGLSAARPSTFANVRTCKSKQVRPDFRTAADAGDLTWIYLNCYHNCAIVFISFDPLGPTSDDRLSLGTGPRGHPDLVISGDNSPASGLRFLRWT